MRINPEESEDSEDDFNYDEENDGDLDDGEDEFGLKMVKMGISMTMSVVISRLGILRF